MLPQYLVVCAGVLIQPFLQNYIAHSTWGLDFHAMLGRVAFALIIGVVILPSIYRSAFDPSKPILIQLAALFPMGLGWQSLFATATKLVIPGH